MIINGNTADWEVIVGMEVHCQVISNSKLFSSAPVKFGEAPNTCVSLVDSSQPGMLPVINKYCVEQAVKTGLGLNAKINKKSVFARKNYFYADLPQGYQISQADQPIIGEGVIEITLADGTEKKIRIERLHLEQDAGKSVHDKYADKTAVDLNRTGTALMEIVSYPDIRSAEEASEYLKKIRSIVRYLGTCDGEMQEGSMRADVNISVRKVGETEFRTRCECKNMNSMKFIQQAINFEAKRQIEAYENGEEVTQNTLRFNTMTGETSPLRSKENANDYRYFPDPDLLPLELHDDMIERIKKELPELPDAKKHRYVNDFGLSNYDASVLTSEKEYAMFFETAVDKCKDKSQAKSVANLMTSELFGLLKKENINFANSPVNAEQIADVSNLIAEGKISSKIAKQIFEIMLTETGKMPSVIMKEKGLEQVNDTGAIEEACKKVVAANPSQTEEFKAGKDKLIGFFVGQVMKETQGKANPGEVNKILIKILKG